MAKSQNLRLLRRYAPRNDSIFVITSLNCHCERAGFCHCERSEAISIGFRSFVTLRMTKWARLLRRYAPRNDITLSSRAKRSDPKLDCFVTLFLAMTVENGFFAMTETI
ncbi:MAG: hypothetical protein Q7R97_03390 [Candidatus Daviesbacteria bacterium]|nr:hypothetical protein [Candidatus Daviesbacteria bacterium]